MAFCHSCLVNLKPGESGTICRLGQMDPVLKRRLADLGISVGTAIQVKQYCLWGGPVMLECGGQLLGIRKKDAVHIEVAVS